MSGKLLILRPHFFNCRLRFINRRIMDAVVDYPIPSESECKPPDGCVSHREKYETQPLPPNS